MAAKPISTTAIAYVTVYLLKSVLNVGLMVRISVKLSRQYKDNQT